MVRIRLKRTGTKNLLCFRVVVVDQRSARDGRTIEEIGFYDPRHNDERLNLERYKHWFSKGAKPTQTVLDLARRISDPDAEAKRRAEANKKAEQAAKEKEKAEKKAAAEKAAAEKAAAGKAEAEKAPEAPKEQEVAETKAD